MKILHKATDYFKSVKREMKKTTFDTSTEVLRNTAIVIAVCTFFAVLFFGIDTGIMAILTKLI